MASLFQGSLVTLIALLPGAEASGQGFSVGKSLHELQLAVVKAEKPAIIFQAKPEKNTGRLVEGIGIQGSEEIPLRPQYAFATLQVSGKPPLGPRWSAECLPFFCRIEHNFAKVSQVPFKFRLGSVEYVDWLEGKGEYVPK